MTVLAQGARAELLRLRRWPAVWVMFGAWMLLNLTFTYLFRYLSYAGDGGGFNSDGLSKQQILAGLMPAGVPAAVLGGMPMFGGAITLTLGALAAGNGYGWGTWKTVYIMRPRRALTAGGSLVALAGIVVAFVVATFAVDLAVASTLGLIEGQDLVMPGFAESAKALGGGVLILGMWTMAGFTLGTLARGPALAVGLGVVWVLAVENLLRGAAGLLSWLEPITNALPGTASGSLVAALGAAPVSQGGAPGVVTNLSGPTAALLAAAYLVVFVVVTGFVVKRRDVA
ncbi:ABC transporter permease [Amycolatopsis sp. NPDC059657]|uniref:ABC transporter permease n=1 Tax=Amycolatopsis sp. NPDC059657 TaxID=3346899 RepID=UPI00366EF92E